jgi:hypothetical protein
MTRSDSVGPASPPLESQPGDPIDAPESSRAKSLRALLALVAPRADGEPAFDGLDWSWTIDRAVAHKVAALLAARLRPSSVWSSLSPAQTAALDAASSRAEAVVGAAERTIQLLDRHLGEAGIPFLVTKGIVLSRLVYPASNLRSFSDLDVVVAPQNVAASVAVLHAQGYRQGQVRQTLGSRPSKREVRAARRATRRFYERFEHEIPFVAPSDGRLLPVDLHWRIAPRRRLPVDADELWRESRTISLAGVEVSALSPEATLVHLALHATTCSLAAFRLLHLCDVAWTVHRAAHDPDRLRHVATQWGARTHLDLVLEVAAHLFDPSIAENGPRPLSRRVTDIAFLVDDVPRSLPERLWRETAWGVAMGCLGHNVARSTAMRWTRARWQARRVLSRSSTLGNDER